MLGVSQTGFTTATVLQELLEQDTKIVAIPPVLQKLLGGSIDRLENGAIHLIETDDIKPVHQAIHTLMFQAVMDGWQIMFVDVANCFNPHLFGEIAADANEEGYQLLKRIQLARPFQIHQSVAIIEQLAKRVAQIQKFQPGKRLLILTGISAQFFDLQQANEDKDFPVPQLEKLRYVLGIIQGLATQGHTVLLTDSTKDFGSSKIINDAKNQKEYPRIQMSALAYTANVHIRIKTEEFERHFMKKVEMLNHPFKEPKFVQYRIQKERRKRKPDTLQQDLSEWF